jgi:hypothetical protein
MESALQSVCERLLGWGDCAEGGVWFIGIEEHGECSQREIDERLRLVEAGKSFEPRGEISGGKGGAAIRTNQGRICAILSGMASDSAVSDEHVRTYIRSTLWKPQSKVCQANLFPLGKARLSQWPAAYRDQTGWEQGDYRKAMQEKRFPHINREFSKSRPSAVVCFGKSFSSDFKRALGMKDACAPWKEDQDLNSVRRPSAQYFRHQSAEIVLAPFFGNGQITACLVYKIAKHLHECGIRLPAPHAF